LSLKMDDKEQFRSELAFSLVVAPFVVALALFGCSLAALSARLFFDILSNAGRLAPAVAVERR
jgi:hypothetical protein